MCRIPENCAFSSQHSTPDEAQRKGAPPTSGLAMLNGGLLVTNPSKAIYDTILSQLQNPSATSNYEFADQSLLSDLYSGRWVAIPYIYNALKTLRWKGVHDPIWKDEEVKNIHYILSPKPWDEEGGEDVERVDETHEWWWKVNRERLADERGKSAVLDGF